MNLYHGIPGIVASRRRFCKETFLSAALALSGQRCWGLIATGAHFSVAEFDRIRILAGAAVALQTKAITFSQTSKAENGQDVHILHFEPEPSVLKQASICDTSALGKRVEALITMSHNLSALVAAWRGRRCGVGRSVRLGSASCEGIGGCGRDDGGVGPR